MKLLTLLTVILIISGCSERQAEEFAFRKTMEYSLKDLCGDKDSDCYNAIESQIKSCMEKSEWRRYLNDSENEVELERFINEFYPCFKKADGSSYFN